jgi:hypothetical protein
LDEVNLFIVFLITFHVIPPEGSEGRKGKGRNEGGIKLNGAGERAEGEKRKSRNENEIKLEKGEKASSTAS